MTLGNRFRREDSGGYTSRQPYIIATAARAQPVQKASRTRTSRRCHRWAEPDCKDVFNDLPKASTPPPTRSGSQQQQLHLQVQTLRGHHSSYPSSWHTTPRSCGLGSDRRLVRGINLSQRHEVQTRPTTKRRALHHPPHRAPSPADGPKPLDRQDGHHQGLQHGGTTNRFSGLEALHGR